MNLFRHLFHRPTVQELAAAELDEAMRAELQWKTAQEYATKMVEYNKARIARLSRRNKP